MTFMGKNIRQGKRGEEALRQLQSQDVHLLVLAEEPQLQTTYSDPPMPATTAKTHIDPPTQWTHSGQHVRIGHNV